MIRILDRYLVREFLAILSFTLLTFVTITFLVDVIERLDRFVDNHVPLPIILKFYGLYIPEKLSLVLPAAMLIASLYTMHRFRRHGELTAMRSNGVSLRRIFVPILTTVLCISGLSLASNEWWPTPVTSRLRHELARERINREPPRNLRQLKDITLQDRPGAILKVGVYLPDEHIARAVDYQQTLNNRIVLRITGSEMRWTDEGWVLTEGYRRDFQNNRESVREVKDEAMKLRIRPEDLERMGINLQPEEMSYRELQQYIAELQALGQDPRKWRVELQNKIAYPLSCFIIAMFGLSLAASPPFGRTSAGWGLALVFCLIYLGINVKVGPELGVKKVLSPMFAAWLGNICFGILGLFSILRTRN